MSATGTTSPLLPIWASNKEENPKRTSRLGLSAAFGMPPDEAHGPNAYLFLAVDLFAGSFLGAFAGFDASGLRPSPIFLASADRVAA